MIREILFGLCLNQSTYSQILPSIIYMALMIMWIPHDVKDRMPCIMHGMYNHRPSQRSWKVLNCKQVFPSFSVYGRENESLFYQTSRYVTYVLDALKIHIENILYLLHQLRYLNFQSKLACICHEWHLKTDCLRVAHGIFFKKRANSVDSLILVHGSSFDVTLIQSSTRLPSILLM